MLDHVLILPYYVHMVNKDYKQKGEQMTNEEKEMVDKIERVHIDNIVAGNTVLCKDGIIRTVCNSNIKRGGFMGTTLFGDSYKIGREFVDKVIIKTAINN